jgi:MFS family permease
VPDPTTVRPSYAALLEIPTLGRVITSMQLARIAQSMVGVALVLFTLAEYDSPALAGVVTFASIFPGLLVSPVAGALLDRHGRIRLVALDYVVATTAMVLIAVLATLGTLPAPLLVAIAIVSSLTGILSVTGLRSLFPLMVPKPLWERVNAIDSNGYVIATILGPPMAAALVALAGPRVAIAVIAIPFGLAALALIGVREPRPEVASTGRLFVDAWEGVKYTWRNPTLRGLGFSISIANLAGGMWTIVIPIVVVGVYGYSEAVVGLVFAASGVAGLVSTSLFGRVDTRGREWVMLVVPLLLFAPVVGLMLPAIGAFGPISSEAGLLLLIASQTLIGLLAGPLDIALFTVRQRRTDPAWLGRAFAVSMAFNFVGYPIGSALTGAIVGGSSAPTVDALAPAVWLGVLASILSGILAAVMIPARAPGSGRS